MADFDFSTLVPDRSASDLELLRDLLSTPTSDWTAEQLAAFNQAISKGAYNYTDLNRVTACMEYLDETLRAYGYRTGYQRIIVPHTGGGGSALPEGYTELEYIRSSGSQYVNTGIIPNQDTRVICEMILEVSSTTNWGFGARTSNALNQYSFLGASAGTYRSDYAAVWSSFPASLNTTEKIKVDKNKNVTTINGENAVTANETTFSAPVPLVLFGVNTNGTITGGITSIFSCQIYDSDTLLREFIPCKNLSGEIGLYDTVEKQFYGNSGSGEFFAGPEKGSLPDGYKELEYIQSSGSQYINTGVSPTQDSKIEIQYQSSQASSGGICVSDIGWQNNGFGIWVNAAAYGDSTVQTVQFYGPDPITVILDKGTLYKDGVQMWQGAAGSFQVPYSLTILALNRSGSISEYTTATLYFCKIYDDGTLIRDFIPCQNETGNVGLYDRVNAQFYSNAGSGAFTAGPEVPPPEPEPTRDPYTWYEADIPTVSTMEAYLGNVSALRSVLTLPEDTAQVPGNMAGLTQTEANQIEEILAVIGAYLEAMITVFRRCGAAICGGPGFYFLN